MSLFNFPTFKCLDCKKKTIHYVTIRPKRKGNRKPITTKKYCDDCLELRIIRNNKKCKSKISKGKNV